MILLADNRGLIHYKLRRNIAAIYSQPLGGHSIEITEEWYDNPVSPHPEVSIKSLFPSEVFLPDLLRFWMAEMARERGMSEPFYLSVFDSEVQQMNALYKAQEYNQRMGLWQD